MKFFAVIIAFGMFAAAKSVRILKNTIYKNSNIFFLNQGSSGAGIYRSIY